MDGGENQRGPSQGVDAEGADCSPHPPYHRTFLKTQFSRKKAFFAQTASINSNFIDPVLQKKAFFAKTASIKQDNKL